MNHALRNAALTLPLSFFMLFEATSLRAAAVFTQHNDLNRTGANLLETALTTANVNSSQFGKLSTRLVDGQVYAQVLYVPALSIPGAGTANVIYVATEHNSVYAFDADSATNTRPIWQVNLGTPILCSQIDKCNRDLLPEIGITSTPVIDPASKTIYVVAETFENNAAAFKLHALDLITGAERPGSPAVISGSVSGDGDASVSGVLRFNAYMHWQRTGLLLWNGNIYFGFGSHQDTQPYHGWIFSYSASTLQQTAIRCLSPHSNGSGIWQSGGAPAVDASGNLYLQTGHGNLSGLGRGDFGISMVKLSADLHPLDFFAPSNQRALSDDDNDFGSSSPLLIPGTNFAVGGGKDGKLFLIDTNNMGSFDPAQNHVPQFWQATFSLLDTGSGGIFGGNVWYNNTLYMWGRRDVLKAFSFDGSNFNIVPSSTSTFAVADGYSSEPALAVSANGSVPNTAILWAVAPNYGPSDGNRYPGTLHAFDAANVSRELWSSDQNASRDALGNWSKWVPPTVVNGKVYVATFDNNIAIYGLLPNAGQVNTFGITSAPASMNLSLEGTADWIHWGDAVLARKATASPMLSDAQSIGRAPAPYANDLRSLSWTDGIGLPTASANTNGMSVYSLNAGLTFTAPAEPQLRVLTVHAGGTNSSSRLTAHLSDGSAVDFVDNTPATIGSYDRDYVLKYQSALPGQTLQVSWVQTSRTGGSSLSGASLATGSLTGSATVLSSANLSAEGTLDWIHWGETPVNRKALPVIAMNDMVVAAHGNPLNFYRDDTRALSWSDGAPAANTGANWDGVYVNGTGNGFSLTVPADTTFRTLRFHGGGWNSAARLTATLSDGSTVPYMDNTPFNGGKYDRDYTLTFRSALPNQTLTLTWVMTGGGGNVTANGAALGLN